MISFWPSGSFGLFVCCFFLSIFYSEALNLAQWQNGVTDLYINKEKSLGADWATRVSTSVGYIVNCGGWEIENLEAN